MQDIRKDQQAKLLIITDDSQYTIDCSVKYIFSDRITFSIPEEVKDSIQYVQEGDCVNAKVFTPFGIKQFDSLVLDISHEGELIVEFAEIQVQEIQRRQYLRVRLTAPISIIKENGDKIQTETVDISGGGIKFISQESYDHEEKVTCELILPKQATPVFAEGIIVKNDPNNIEHYVLIFTRINESDRDKIVQTCFKVDLHLTQMNVRNTK